MSQLTSTTIDDKINFVCNTYSAFIELSLKRAAYAALLFSLAKFFIQRPIFYRNMPNSLCNFPYNPNRDFH